jgi:hypothetical protein
MSVDITELHQSIAKGNGFELYRHYSESQAAKFLGVHPVTLKKKRLAGKISYLRLGERSLKYFGYQIADHFLNNTICHDIQNANFNLETTGLVNGEIHPPIAGHGSTRAIGKHAEFLSAQRILKKPKSC